jgi:hypothetical protein
MAKYNINHTIKDKLIESLIKPIHLNKPLVENKFDSISRRLKKTKRITKTLLVVCLIQSIYIGYQLYGKHL